MNNHIPLLFVAFLFSITQSCTNRTEKSYTDHCTPLRTDNILEIVIEIQTDTLKTIKIHGKQEMKDFITDLNNSNVNGPWKGAKWDQIILKYDDGITTFNTNGKVFGEGASVIFYDLNDKYKKYWKK